MIDKNATVRKHLATAKEHLAGLAAAAAWHHDLSVRELLDNQKPVKDEPIVKPKGAGK
jgi:hypothetical protein